MKSWIAAWIFVFAAGLLLAVLLDKADRKKNRGVAALMVAIMIAAGLLIAYR